MDAKKMNNNGFIPLLEGYNICSLIKNLKLFITAPFILPKDFLRNTTVP
jgi:hypothetical protein